MKFTTVAIVLATAAIARGVLPLDREVRYLMTHEFARTAEDIVWRRSKLGLRLSADEVKALDDWIATHRSGFDRPLREAGGRA